MLKTTTTTAKTSLLVFTGTAVGIVFGPYVIRSIHSSLKARLLRRAIDKEIIIIPPPQCTQSSEEQKEEDAAICHDKPHNILLMIFPGAFLHQNEYISIGKHVQKQFTNFVSNQNSIKNNSINNVYVTVGIGPIMDRCPSQYTKWVFGGDPNIVATAIRQKAQRVLLSSKSNEGDECDAQDENDREKQQQQVKMQEKEETPFYTFFDDIFVWGHSLGSYAAINISYPSSVYTGIITYGASWDLLQFIPDMNKTSQSLISYPKPTLTMIGQRDGFLRYLLLSKDIQCFNDTLLSKRKQLLSMYEQVGRRASKNNCPNSNRSSHDRLALMIERGMILEKPIIAVPELNHMHMSMGILPICTTRTGRSDMITKYGADTDQPHSVLAKIVLDFIFVHSSINPKQQQQLSSSKLKQQCKERILQQCDLTQKLLLPFLELSSLESRTKFVQELVVQKCQNAMSVSSLVPEDCVKDSNNIMVTVDWREEGKDFTYSKPKLILAVDTQSSTEVDGTSSPSSSLLLQVQVAEQEPINVATFLRDKLPKGAPLPRIGQISKTLAIKTKSIDALLQKHQQLSFKKVGDVDSTVADNNDTNTSTTVAAPVVTTKNDIIQKLNQSTFDFVLNHVVSKEQRERYLSEGSQLVFGSDYHVVRCPNTGTPAGPMWVKTPLLLTRELQEGNHTPTSSNSSSSRYCYTLRSPYMTTPTSLANPAFSGMYYLKPLTAGQAYEWIVFDSFKIM